MTTPLRLRFDAGLQPLLAPRRRGRDVEVPPDGTSTLGHVVESLGVPLPEVGALTVDGEPVLPSYRPGGGELVTVASVAWPQRLPGGRPLRFLLDVHLGTLARRLRLLGVDTAWAPHADDPDLVAAAADQGRVLLTRDRGLLRRRALPAGALLRADRPDEQVAEVVGRFAPPLAPFTRCPACNGELAAVPKESVAAELEPGTRRSYDDYSRCRRCRRVYWRGAHAARLEQIVSAATARQAERGTTTPG